MKITSHAVCVVNVNVREDGVVFMDRMWYTKRGRSVRHVMETGEEGETVEHTLYVGTLHEMAADASNFRYHLLAPVPVLVEFGPDEKRPGGTHMKVTFAVTCEGKLRDFDRPDGDEILGPVTMVEVSDLLRETEGKTVPFHVRSTKAALVTVAGNKKVFDRYRKIILAYNQPELSDEQKTAVEAYPYKW